MYAVETLFDLNHSLAGAYLARLQHPHQALDGIRLLIQKLGAALPEEYIEHSPQVWIHTSASVAPSAEIMGPCIIGPRTQIRQCAFIRGDVLIGEDCVVGNSTEIKNAILFDGVQVPHFNYVGDSILGYRAHLGAGAIISNVRGDKGQVVIHTADELQTGRKKVGAMVGDYAEVGCNAVLNPGTVLGRHTQVYPTACVRGVVPENYIWRLNGTIVPRKM